MQNPALIVGGVLSATASLAHLATIVGGPSWYRFMGAGEGMARMAERGELRPTLITLGIAAVLAIWAAYAFSGAGLISRLPLIRTALMLISAVYLARALIPIPVFLVTGGGVTPFWVWSSLIVLLYGVCYALGTWIAWPALSAR